MDRQTKQRFLLMELFKKSEVPISPKEAFEKAREKFSNIGLTTVYRFVKEFLNEGILIAAEIPGKAKKYELAGKAHHHFFKCIKCLKIYPIDRCPNDLETIIPNGFQLISHEIMLFGICQSCSK